MTRQRTMTDSAVLDLAVHTELSFEQIETGIALMRTGRADLIEAVIAGPQGAEAGAQRQR